MCRRFSSSHLAAVLALLSSSFVQAGALDRPGQTGNALDPANGSATPSATPGATAPFPHFQGTSLDQPATAAGQKYTILGRVIEKFEGGLIVACSNPGTIGNKKAAGFVYLTGHPDEARLFSGSAIKCTANQTGTRTVDAGNGATTTLPTFVF